MRNRAMREVRLDVPLQPLCSGLCCGSAPACCSNLCRGAPACTSGTAHFRFAVLLLRLRQRRLHGVGPSVCHLPCRSLPGMRMEVHTVWATRLRATRAASRMPRSAATTAAYAWRRGILAWRHCHGDACGLHRRAMPQATAASPGATPAASPQRNLPSHRYAAMGQRFASSLLAASPQGNLPSHRRADVSAPPERV